MSGDVHELRYRQGGRARDFYLEIDNDLLQIERLALAIQKSRNSGWRRTRPSALWHRR